MPKKPTGKNDDIVIAVMGPTGVGKSTFINCAAGSDAAVVGHNLKSCTAKVEPHRVTNNGLDVVFVDTPGFNDTHLNDTVILELVAAWLKKSYEKGTKLSGIIYLHDISQARMFGTSIKSLEMFGKLCGRKALHTVALATTKWARVPDEEGEGRENELRETYWKDMLDLGSDMVRFTASHESAWSIVSGIIAKKQTHVLLIQEELTILQRTVPETAAGRALRAQLQELAQKPEVQRNEQKEKLILEQLEKLRVPFSRRLAMFLSFKKPSSRGFKFGKTSRNIV